MEKIIAESLTLLGVDQLSVRFLLAAYRIAPAGIAEIAFAADIKRSTAYLLSKQLLASGLLLEDRKKYNNRVYPLSPDDLLRRISASQHKFRWAEIQLEEKLPEIRSCYQFSDLHPKITFYEGNPGLLQVWENILSAKTEILLWTDRQTENLYISPDNHARFLTGRLTKGIPVRVLATDSPQARKMQETDNQSLCRTKILPDDTHFSTQTYIYDHKVAVFVYHKSLIGIITENAAISSFHRAGFELVWKSLP